MLEQTSKQKHDTLLVVTNQGPLVKSAPCGRDPHPESSIITINDLLTCGHRQTEPEMVHGLSHNSSNNMVIKVQIERVSGCSWVNNSTTCASSILEQKSNENLSEGGNESLLNAEKREAHRILRDDAAFCFRSLGVPLSCISQVV